MIDDPRTRTARSRLALREGESPTVALARHLRRDLDDPWPLLEAHDTLVRGPDSTRRMQLAREDRAARLTPPQSLDPVDLCHYRLAAAGDPESLVELARRHANWPGREPVDKAIRRTRDRLDNRPRVAWQLALQVALVGIAVLFALMVIENPLLLWVGLGLVWLIPWWRRSAS